MSEPKHITDTLNAIAAASNENRALARERVAKFRLDREKGEKPLPVVNLTTGSGAPLLRVDDVLRRSLPSYGKR